MVEQKDDLGVFVIGVEQDTYKKLQEVAKKEGKSVVDVTSEALSKRIEDSKSVNESTGPKRLLTEER